MKLTGFELRRVLMPLRAPFRTSFGSESSRDVLLVRTITEHSEGWGECVAMAEPLYSAEYTDAAADVIRRLFVPRLLAADDLSPDTVASLLACWRGHRMAKAALEMAVLDAWLRAAGISFATFFGASRTRVPAGVSIGIKDSVAALLDEIATFLAEGYLRVKLKIQPGWDVEVVRAVRERFGSDVLLQVDANAAYTIADAPTLARLDEFDLVLIEQPLADDDLFRHSVLAQRIRTPVCLDESITSARVAADAIRLGAAQVVNIKPGRVGGYLEARRIHDLCQAHGTAVWCGGMLESGLGRAANLALAAMPGFTLPGDISASDRYYAQDLTPPFVLEEGHVAVPDGPGLGVEPLQEALDAHTTTVEWIPAGG